MLRRTGFLTGAIATLVAAPLAAGALLGACGDDTTSSKRVSLRTEITAGDEVKAPFTTATGWSIQVTALALSVGSLYYFDGASIFNAGRGSAFAVPSNAGRGSAFAVPSNAGRGSAFAVPSNVGRGSAFAVPSSRLDGRAAPRDRLAGLIGVRPAFAHPGHYEPGNAMGQVLASSSADLLQGTVALPDGEGVAGVYRSARFTFEGAPTGGAADALSGHVVVLEAEATKGAMTRIFRATADIGDVLDSYGEPRLDGCSFEGQPDVQGDGVVTLHVKPSVWLDQAELDDVPESAGGAPVDLARDGAAFKAFARGLKKGSAVVFSYSPVAEGS